jgi:hypothetical protein
MELQCDIWEIQLSLFPRKVDRYPFKSWSLSPQKHFIQSSQKFSCHFSLKKWTVILLKVDRFPLKKFIQLSQKFSCHFPVKNSTLRHNVQSLLWVGDLIWGGGADRTTRLGFIFYFCFPSANKPPEHKSERSTKPHRLLASNIQFGNQRFVPCLAVMADLRIL